MSLCRLGGLSNLGGGRVGPSVCDVLRNRSVEEEHVLGDKCHGPTNVEPTK
jgi:hypothetical protein